MGYATFRYRMGKDGKLESKVFDSDNVPASGWHDSPAKCVPAAESNKAEASLETREELIAECKKRGIEVHHRAGIEKLKALLGD